MNDKIKPSQKPVDDQERKNKAPVKEKTVEPEAPKVGEEAIP